METFKQSVDLSAHDRVRRFHGHISILSLEETRQDAEILAQMQIKADAELAQNMLEDLQDHEKFLKDIKGHWIIRSKCNMKQVQIILSKGAKGLTGQLTAQALQTRGSGLGGAFAAAETSNSANEPISAAAELLGTLRVISQQNAETAAATANMCPRANGGTIEDFGKQLQMQNGLITEVIDTMRAKVKQEEAGLSGEEAGLSGMEEVWLSKLEKVEERAEERAKRIGDTCQMNFNELRALVAGGPDKKHEIVDWWRSVLNYDIETIDGQYNMFSLIATERDMEKTVVPDDIMSIIKGTCWAFYLSEDKRINGYTNEIFCQCQGKILTAEQISEGVVA